MKSRNWICNRNDKELILWQPPTVMRKKAEKDSDGDNNDEKKEKEKS